MLTIKPGRGEIWEIQFDPSVGDEIKKIRPAVVMSPLEIGRMQLRVVVPITGWQPQFARYPWMTWLPPTQQNGLSKESAADAFQIKSISTQRFQRKLGLITLDDLNAITAAVALCIGYRTHAMPALVAALCQTPHRAA